MCCTDAGFPEAFEPVCEEPKSGVLEARAAAAPELSLDAPVMDSGGRGWAWLGAEETPTGAGKAQLRGGFQGSGC